MRGTVLTLLLLLGALAPREAVAQSPVLARYIPGNYLSDNRHLVELANPGGQTIDLDGYLLVTRDYSVRLPPTARLAPGGVFRIARLPGSGVSLALSRTPDFLIRFHFLEHEGHYLALFNPDMRIVEAVYFSPVPNVPFLPDRDTCITFDGKKLPFYLPPENREVWQYVRTQGNRAGFVKVKGRWELGAEAVVAPPAATYQDMTLRYQEGLVTLHWSAFEEGCRFYQVERSEDQANYVPVGRLDAHAPSKDMQRYTFYEQGLAPGRRYYYRLRAEDAFGNPVFSPVREILAVEVPSEFTMEVRPTGTGLSLRFISQFSQQVRIKVFDEDMREVAILFNDYVFAETPNLVRMGQGLEPGRRYLVLATTEARRFGQEFVAGALR